jgi:hypothetical protein
MACPDPVDEIQLQLVAHGVRPACIYETPTLARDVEGAGPIRDRALELGLAHLRLPGVETEGWEGEMPRLSGHLFYSEDDPEMAGQIAYLLEHGRNDTPEGTKIISRVLGFPDFDFVDYSPGILPDKGKIRFVIHTEPREGHDQGYLNTLWEYDVIDMFESSTHEAALTSEKIRRAIGGLWNDPESALRDMLRSEPEIYIETKFTRLSKGPEF